jgi:hypothetical protein
MLNGFVNNTDEILKIDNSLGNKYDCYMAIREFLRIAKKKFIILVHDDVIFNKNRMELVHELEKSISSDAQFAIFGIAGTTSSPYNAFGHFISHKGEEIWGIPKNETILSLDECFIIINKDSGIDVSDNLHGFHFYGTDLCLNAQKKGYKSTVIDFLITHISPGSLNDEFLKSRLLFEEHLAHINCNYPIVTTCTALYGGKKLTTQARSIAIAILKPHFGGHRDAHFVKRKLLTQIWCDKKLRITVRLLIIYIGLKSLLLLLIRRVGGDINWWMKNWKVRLN